MITEVSAGGIVYKMIEGNHYFLLVQHRKALHWGFPKGHIGDTVPGETAEKAALREVQEEGGVTAHIINPTPIITTYFFREKRDLHKKSVHYFLMEYIAGSPDLHDHEVKEAVFLPEDEAWDTLTYNTDREAFSEFLRILNTDLD